ncbi:S41 family peptidase [Cohnella luojiensis]|uniref:PDZ domain-containing protein n=1 Tax=Cohnella luojiensis TaxID=652876 RepID=A0A4Y8M1R7_9BACL|nr:S41 family peptidase [Cohnella luojiensis]TFE29063.1 PDZ domain-containing protein [Cohnella luojiensis]
MWFRGRTVVAMMVLTTIAACMATYAYFELPEWGFQSSSAQTGTAAPYIKDGLSQDELDKLNKALGLIENRFIDPMDREKLVDGAIQGMVESLRDPYSVYKPEVEADQFNEMLQGAFTGIGANLRVDNGSIVVEAPIRGSPAERAGLQPDDILLSINGESLHGLTLSEAVGKIRGPKGTKAKLKVQRGGAADPIELELVRDRIDLETVHSEIGSDGVGHLIINQFGEDTSVQVAEELKAMEEKGLKALVIDVRDNPGGLLQSVIDVADQFMEKGKVIVQSEYRNGKRKVDVAANGAKNDKFYPLIVLVNNGSASAAEILAGALKQSANAVIMGETTYGKGTVQVPFNDELGDRSMVKLTVYKWLLPDGTWIHEKGITPDIEVIQPEYFLASRLPRDYVLKYDTTGEAVTNLQNILAGVGFPADRTDGYFSQATKSALEQFQASESLPVTGDVNAETAQRLEEALYINLQNPVHDKQLQAALTEAREKIQVSP